MVRNNEDPCCRASSVAMANIEWTLSDLAIKRGQSPLNIRRRV